MIVLWVTIVSACFVDINLPTDDIKVKNAGGKFR
jgi:hypothetical protein